MEWIEANIGYSDANYTKKREFLRKDIFPIIDKYRKKAISWHFLWESTPWPNEKKMGTTLRLRFLLDSEEGMKTKKY